MEWRTLSEVKNHRFLLTFQGGLKNDFYKFQLKDMTDKRSIAATRKSDVRGEGLGDINALLGRKLTSFQKTRQAKTEGENLYSDEEFEEIDLE